MMYLKQFDVPVLVVGQGFHRGVVGDMMYILPHALISVQCTCQDILKDDLYTKFLKGGGGRNWPQALF